MERTLNALRCAGWKVLQHVDQSDGRVQWTMTHPEQGPVTIEADSDTEALTTILKQAGISPSEAMFHDNGPWVAGMEEGEAFLQSEDFTHDVRLYVNGAFGRPEDRLAYARNLAVEMNAIPKIKTPGERRATRLRAFAATVVQSVRDVDAVRYVLWAIGGAIGFLALALLLTGRPEREPVEAHADAYRDAKTALSTCPAAARAIHEALADGRLSVDDARQLGQIVQRATYEYQAGKEMAAARVALGLKADPLPPRCSGVRPGTSDDGGHPVDLFQDYPPEHD